MSQPDDETLDDETPDNKTRDNKKTAADYQPPFPVFFEFCSEGGTRTRDTTIMSRVL